MKHGHWVLNWTIHTSMWSRWLQNTVTVAPYPLVLLSKRCCASLFLDGTAAIGFVKIKDGDTTKAGQIGLRPGIAVKLNDHFSFVAKYGFLGYRRNVNTSGDSLVWCWLAKIFLLVSTTISNRVVDNKKQERGFFKIGNSLFFMYYLYIFTRLLKKMLLNINFGYTFVSLIKQMI